MINSALRREEKIGQLDFNIKWDNQNQEEGKVGKMRYDGVSQKFMEETISDKKIYQVPRAQRDLRNSKEVVCL